LLRRFSGGEFDMVSVGRSQIADPEWVSKVHRLEFGRIRPFKRSDMRMSDSDVAAEARRF